VHNIKIKILLILIITCLANCVVAFCVNCSSAAQEVGACLILSLALQVEKLGLLSTAEKLGLLETAENLLVTDPGKITALSIPALLASLGEPP
jgi:hypothetical protein